MNVLGRHARVPPSTRVDVIAPAEVGTGRSREGAVLDAWPVEAGAAHDMSATTKIAVGVTAGYLLGRMRKLRLAITVGGLLAGQRVATNPQALLSQGNKLIENNPELRKLRGEITGRLLDAARDAAILTASSRLESMTESLTALPGMNDEDQDEYDDEDEYDEDEDEDDVDESQDEAESDESDRKPRRRRSRAAAASVGSGTRRARSTSRAGSGR